MRRKTLDALLTTGGLLLTILLAVAGGLLLWGHDFAQSNVQNQLAQQQITFPTAAQLAHPNGTEITPTMQQTLGRYAGKQVLTGAEARAYADDYIAVHLSEMPYHGVYSQISTAALAQPDNAQLKALETTSFQGTTLRGLLLEAYGFSQFGSIALIASVVSFVGAGLMLILSAFGLWHLRRVDASEEVGAKTLHLGDQTVPAGI
jgi:hypothetical protein